MTLVHLFPISPQIFQFSDFSLESLNFFGKLIVLLPNLTEYDENFISFFGKDLVVIGMCGGQLLQIAILTSQLAHYVLVRHVTLYLFVLKIVALALQLIERILGLKCRLSLAFNFVLSEGLLDRSVLHFPYVSHWTLQLSI